MKRTLATLAATALLGTLGTVPAQAADTPGCVSPHERYSVRIGWTRHQVAVVFDTKGKVLNEQGYIFPNWRVYKRCSTVGYNLGIKYHRNGSGVWHVVQKPVIGD
jgi:hypothetical protein